MKKSYLLFIFSFVIVAWGQPDFSRFLSLVASGVGFALFWLGLFSISNPKKRFFLSFFWFALVQAVQLSWLISIEYQGIYILFVYGFLLLFLGMQFGCLTFFFPNRGSLKNKNILLIGSLWTLFEWSRLFIFCGFAWNPIGLSMTAFAASSQLASVFGVFGLSFWTVIANLLFLKAFLRPMHPSFKLIEMPFFAKKFPSDSKISSRTGFANRKNFYLKNLYLICLKRLWRSLFLFKKWDHKIFTAIIFFLFPYLFGFLHLYYHDHHHLKQRKFYDIALVQTALRPDEKSFFFNSKRTSLSPYEQWSAILNYLKQGEVGKWDLIVLPEYALPFSAYAMVYAYEDVEKVLKDIWRDDQKWTHLLIDPFAQTLSKGKETKWYVNNLFWAKALSEHYGAEIALGLDAQDPKEERNYNAAFHIQPRSLGIHRYEKRVLLPCVEYLPFSFIKPLIAKFGIVAFFSHGKEAKVFQGKCLLNFSICYEECFGHLIREGKKGGAELFVNMTNDAWFPSSRLPYKHFYHGKLRSIENGVPLVRACNTGITGAVDSLGRVVGTFGHASPEWKKGVFSISLDLYNFSTLYTLFGDTFIILICLICFFYSWTSKWCLKVKKR